MEWPPAAEDLADAVGALVRQSFERHGFLAPAAFVFATRNPETGRRIEPTLLTFILYGTPSSFGTQLRQIALDLGAVILVQAYEIRMVGDLDDQCVRGHERLDEHPEANDYLVLFVEDGRVAKTRAWLASIDMVRAAAIGARTPTGQLALGRFSEVPVRRVDGWLTALLPTVN